jgi:hypothetical protein
MTRAQGSLLAGITILAAAGVFFLKETGKAPAETTSPAAASPVSKTTDGPAVKPSRATPATPVAGLPALPRFVESPHPPGSEEDREWVATRVAALADLAWLDDAESLHKILAELRNPVPEIRAAALTATKTFASRDAVPYLTALAAETGDTEEQKALNDLIEYLNLPTMLEQIDDDSGK